VERIGIERTRDIAENADLVLFMVDTERGWLAEDQELYRRVLKKEKILVVNKRDLWADSETIDTPDDVLFKDVIYISAKFDRDIDTLVKKIHRFGTEGWEGGESGVVPNLRQKKLFEKAAGACGAARRALEEGASAELAVLDLKDALDALDEITGTSVKADVLDAVFSRFCIGK
jgi:tRNA modification GTPase